MAEVTIAHRKAAIEAWYGPNPPRVALAVRDTIKPWEETGELVRDGSPTASLTICLARIAKGYADAEARGREGGVAASLAAVQARQHEFCALAADAKILEADGSVEANSSALLGAGANALEQACALVDALRIHPAPEAP